MSRLRIAYQDKRITVTDTFIARACWCSRWTRAATPTSPPKHDPSHCTLHPIQNRHQHLKKDCNIVKKNGHCGRCSEKLVGVTALNPPQTPTRAGDWRYRGSKQFQRPKILTKLLPNRNHDCPFPQIKDLSNVPALRDFDFFGRPD